MTNQEKLMADIDILRDRAKRLRPEKNTTDEMDQHLKDFRMQLNEVVKAMNVLDAAATDKPEVWYLSKVKQ